jgi:alpha-N-arabinofuranosidase
MAQGTRVTRNLLHDNKPSEDLFVEVDHGPFLIEHNLFLSPIALFDMSQGGAYVHNLFTGRIVQRPELRRETPFHPPHSTKVAGLRNIQGGDDRFYNNIFVNAGLTAYDTAKLPVFMTGNVFLNGAKPSKHESNPLVRPEFDPGIKLVEKSDGIYLEITLEKVRGQQQCQVVTTELLGKAKIPDLPYEKPDGSPYRIDTDYPGQRRSTTNPFPGPFENTGEGKLTLKVW